MQLSGAAEMAVMVLLIALIWTAGAAWIKACDYIEVRRTHLQRIRTRQAMGPPRDRPRPSSGPIGEIFMNR
ncbi:MAG: hypothetical protein JSR98_06375 [Proteobacteria bacterium]|nr:hypothetical protein [Pseudomonadota bacterium]